MLSSVTSRVYPYFSILVPICPYLSLFVPICPYLSLLVLICPYQSLFVTICAYLCLLVPISPYFSLFVPVLWSRAGTITDIITAAVSRKQGIRQQNIACWLCKLKCYIFLEVITNIGTLYQVRLGLFLYVIQNPLYCLYLERLLLRES